MRSLFWIIFSLTILVRIAAYRHDFSDGNTVKITAKVSSEPVVYDTARGVKINGLWTYLPLYPKVEYGDLITVKGQVQDGVLNKPEIISFDKASNFYSLRRRLLSFYYRSLPQDHAALVAGFTIGSKEGISKDLWEALKTTGTAHVVVASGMNVTLVASFLVNSLVKVMRRRAALVVSFTGIWIYVVIAGADAPLIRAAVMGSFAFTVQALGRIRTSWNIFFMSAGAMLLVKPEWIWDLGYILSFMATASIMLLEYPIRRRLSLVPKFIQEDLSTTLAAQIGVIPILLYTFGYINVLSPLINVLVLWTVVPVTVVGGVVGLVGVVFPEVARLFLIGVYPFTWWFLFVVELFS